MAGDTAAWSCDIVVGYNKKVFKTPDGWLFGCTGAVREIAQVHIWMMGGQQGKPPVIKQTSVMAASPSGIVHLASEHTKGEFYLPEVPHYVIGMGHEFAFGCLAAGVSAEETVRLAIKHIPFLGGEMTSERLHPLTIKRKPTLRNARRG